ncbi:MAG: hypothetical protein JWL83_3014, partial [Actinomycetia bacterium]|nr:hypothetical protein [Actinomycetes bacterium]
MRVRVLHVRVRQTFATIVLGVLAAGILPVLSASPAHAAPGGGAANLDQCANGSAGTIICAASAWQNGNLNQNKAHWYEGDSVPYRLTMSSVPTATASTVIVQWDTT